MPPSELLSGGGLVAHDAEWQFPAITEQHAFHRLRQVGVPGGVIYVAFPFATLIDRLDRRTPEAEPLRAALVALCRDLPPLPRVTVCQHIGLRLHLGLFAEAGIGDIFWPHATPQDLTAPDALPRLHPFPLFPVQVPEALPESLAETGSRDYLFCFAGARAQPWYLTRVRDWILDDLAGDPRGTVIGRETWHYNRVVYDHQIARKPEAADPAALVDAARSAEFGTLLRQSLFALCPSGTGPNSIRLWEALGAGAIPVILSDRFAPPGDPALWATATVTCPEDRAALRALPDRLAALAAEPVRLAAMRAAGRAIWHRYGPAGFVPDIEELLCRRAAEPEPWLSHLALLRAELARRADTGVALLEAEQRLAAALAERDQLTGSLSWRLTAPLRRLRRLGRQS